MGKEKSQDIIDLCVNKDVVGVKDAFNSKMNTAVNDVLNSRREELAKTVFNFNKEREAQKSSSDIDGEV